MKVVTGKEEIQSIAQATVVAEAAAKEFLTRALAGELSEWQLLFNLARRIHAIPGAVDLPLVQLMPAFTAFYEYIRANRFDKFRSFAGELFEERWIEFVDAFTKVRFPEGTGPLEAAFALAKQHPIVPTAAISESYALLASTAYHLQLSRGDNPIFLPVERVGGLFGKDKMFGSRLVALLVRNQIVQVVDADHGFRRAKTYRFRLDSGRYSGPFVAEQLRSAR